MNVVLLVIDSLRACSLGRREEEGPRTPFLDALAADTVSFSRAYASECWTLPTHCSMFTGLLPSEHGAHFQTMGYTRAAPTIAELLARAGYETEIVTRNFIFDGTIAGITRGFHRNIRPLSTTTPINPFALFLAIAKPRFRRHIRETGFFHPFQKNNRRFLATFARSLLPADRRALEYVADFMLRKRREGRPYFLFCNLYDVHAPYPPTPRSILRSFWSVQGCIENLMFPKVMASLGAHAYLRPGFRLSERGRRMLLDRYHRAIELMDEKLADFFAAARSAGVLDNTLLILTSDHGEAFGDHGLYLHDASVYNTHLHVPLWIRHPDYRAERVDEVVSTRHLFDLMRSAALDHSVHNTLLEPGFRAENPIALAEHYRYARLTGALPRYRQNLAAAVVGSTKLVLHGGGADRYDLHTDAGEISPATTTWPEIESIFTHAAGPAAAGAALSRLRRWSRENTVEPGDAVALEPVRAAG
jgi:membrane-anchored protein YejM (alkaline phosphatase superfamily)